MADSLDLLAKEQEKLDRQVVDYSVKILAPFYEKRREVVAKIPRFWSIVLAETEPLRPYITYEDSLVFDTLEDFWVEWEPGNSRNITTWFRFGENPHFGPQTLSKKLLWHEGGDNESDEDDGGYYYSDAPTVIDLKENSSLLNQHQNGDQESFFTWFAYTTTDKKDDRDENTTIAQVLVEELYPGALDLYKYAQSDEIAEEYDISDLSE